MGSIRVIGPSTYPPGGSGRGSSGFSTKKTATSITARVFFRTIPKPLLRTGLHTVQEVCESFVAILFSPWQNGASSFHVPTESLSSQVLVVDPSRA